MSTKQTNPKDAIGATKVALSLLSPIAKAAWSLAQFAGMTKYGHYNWRVSGVRMSIYLDAIDRHRDALLSGEWYDPIDGTPHLGNIMACCAIILDAHAAGKLVDDRPPSVSLRPIYAEVEAQMARLKAQYADKNPKHYYIEDTQVEQGTPPTPVVIVDLKPRPIAIGDVLCPDGVESDNRIGPVAGISSNGQFRIVDGPSRGTYCGRTAANIGYTHTDGAPVLPPVLPEGVYAMSSPASIPHDDVTCGAV